MKFKMPRSVGVLLLLMVSGISHASDPQEFHCLDGAKDPAPYQPGNVVRWCEISKDGNVLYHGSVWRWYPSGQMQGKEFYIYGKANGEWSAWYENGKPSSLGTFKMGDKSGLWKYWSEEGWLKTEVTYADDGNLWTEYYPTGSKKATGQTLPSGKIGLWTYWDAAGNEKAKCNFEGGIFAISSEPCAIIAKELDPKGYSRPVPIVATLDSYAVLSVASEKYRLTIPKGWNADTKIAKDERIPLVFYPDGGSWRGQGPNIYISVLYRNGAAFDAVVKDESEFFQENIADYKQISVHHGKQRNGRSKISRTISYKPLIQTDSPFSIVSNDVIHEETISLDASDNTVVVIVLTCHDEAKLKEFMPILDLITQSFSAQGKS